MLRSGSKPKVLETKRASELDPDGRRVLVQAGDLWVHDLARSTFTRFAVAESDVGGAFPVLTPDGTRAYLTYSRNHLISVIDTDPNSPTYNQEVDVIESWAQGFGGGTGQPGGLIGFAIHNEGSLALSPTPGTNDVLLFDIEPSD